MNKNSHVKAMSVCMVFLLVFGPVAPAMALPHGGKILSGKGTISTSGSTETISQSSGGLSIGWGSFNIGSGQTVRFIQPSSSSVALNFISGTSASQIFGHLTANGQIYLMNPYGILFGPSAQVNVGGLIAAGMNLQKYAFGTQAVFSGGGNVTNAGQIVAGPGGTVALVGQNVSNTGTITENAGSIALGAGNSVTLDFSGTDLVHLIVNQNTAQAAIDNGGLLKANGGEILLKAGAQNSLVSSVVNNTGLVEAETVGEKNGRIVLLSGMDAGTTNVSGTLDASAPSGGNGGTIETSGNRVNVANGTVVTTESADGLTGTWTLDPASFYIGMNTGTANDTAGNVLNYEDISGSSLATTLNSTNVVIDSTQGAKGALGNIYVNDSVSWNSVNSLTLNAVNNIEINKAISNSGTGNVILRADDMSLGGVATNTAGGGVPSGVGTVDVNTGGSVSTLGQVEISTNPTNYNVALSNPGTAGGSYSNGNSSGTLTAYDLLSTNTDLYYIDQNQNAVTLGNNYALNQSLTLPSFGATGSDGEQIAFASSANGYSSPTSSTYSNWLRLGGTATPFSGTFNGNGYSIGNMVIDDSTHVNVGFFGETSGSSLVENMGVSGGSVIGSYSNDSAGGLVGLNYGEILHSYGSDTVAGGANAGGLVGYNSGTIMDTYATGNVSSTQGWGSGGGLVGYSDWGNIYNSYATGNVTGGSPSYSGGFIGNLYNGTISNSYATGNASGNYAGGFISDLDSGGSISNSYATGNAWGSWYVGGFIAVNGGSGPITNSFYNSTQSAGAGGTPLSISSSGFGTQSNFTGWSFNSFSGGAFSSPGSVDSWFMGTNPAGIVAPILIPDMGTATITAKNESMVYSGSTYSGPNSSVETTSMGASPVSTTGMSYGGTSSTGTNVGNYSITPEGLSLSAPVSQSSLSGIIFQSGTLSITPATLSASTTAGKLFNGTGSIGLDGSNFLLTGVDGQTATLTQPMTGMLNSQNVGVNIGGILSITGSDLSGKNGFLSDNYILPSSFTGGTIFPDPVHLFPLSSVLEPVQATPSSISPNIQSLAREIESEEILNGETYYLQPSDVSLVNGGVQTQQDTHYLNVPDGVLVTH